MDEEIDDSNQPLPVDKKESVADVEKQENQDEEQKNTDIDGNESSDSVNSWDDPDPLFQDIYQMLKKPTKLMRGVTLIHDKIHLGGRKEMLDVQQLKNIGITHIVHCAEDESTGDDALDHEFWTNYHGDSVEYFGFVADDARGYDMIGKHWHQCKQFLEKVLVINDAKVMIACQGGTNRSCTILAAALMHFHEMDCKSAVKAIHDKKYPVLTNSSFIRQLIAFGSN